MTSILQTRTPHQPSHQPPHQLPHQPGTAPAVHDVRDALRVSVDDEVFERVWRAACDAISVPPTVSELDDEQLDALLNDIACHDRLCHVFALTWRIRCATARKLHQLGR